MSAMPPFQWIPYFGGPHDGQQTAMSDGVREMLYGGYYQAEEIQVPMVAGGAHLSLVKRVASWHATVVIPEPGET